jgi:hypothetical protein
MGLAKLKGFKGTTKTKKAWAKDVRKKY